MVTETEVRVEHARVAVAASAIVIVALILAAFERHSEVRLVDKHAELLGETRRPVGAEDTPHLAIVEQSVEASNEALSRLRGAPMDAPAIPETDLEEPLADTAPFEDGDGDEGEWHAVGVIGIFGTDSPVYYPYPYP